MRNLLSALFILLFAFKVYCWNDHAHMTIAGLAWEKLSDASKAQVTSILQEHPEYKKNWKSAYQPHKSLVVLGKYLMMRASMWPDEIKNSENGNFSYNRKEWHYIVQKLYLDKPVDEKNPEIQYSKDSSNIVWAITHVQNSIKNTEISTSLKAVYLSWLIHLTADIHQPLHTCALFDNNKLKRGDRGGNALYIRTATDTTNLQRFWDNQLGETVDVRKNLQHGFILKRNFPFDEKYINEMNPSVWANDSYIIAKNEIYLNGKLKYALTKKRSIPLVSETYVQKAKTIAEQQAAYAGYRLAAQISTLL